jgi:hypothetical protein
MYILAKQANTPAHPNKLPKIIADTVIEGRYWAKAGLKKMTLGWR